MSNEINEIKDNEKQKLKHVQGNKRIISDLNTS